MTGPEKKRKRKKFYECKKIKILFKNKIKNYLKSIK